MVKESCTAVIERYSQVADLLVTGNVRQHLKQYRSKTPAVRNNQIYRPSFVYSTDSLRRHVAWGTSDRVGTELVCRSTKSEVSDKNTGKSARRVEQYVFGLEKMMKIFRPPWRAAVHLEIYDRRINDGMGEY